MIISVVKSILNHITRIKLKKNIFKEVKKLCNRFLKYKIMLFNTNISSQPFQPPVSDFAQSRLHIVDNGKLQTLLLFSELKTANTICPQ